MAKSKSLLEEAKDRYRRCHEFEADFRQRFLDDMKFTVGDSENNYQWKQSARDGRANRPMITINKTRQHALMIVNDQRQNAMSMQVRPVNGEATYKAAEIYEGLIRHIEDDSKAQNVYNKAYYDAVAGGIGWWRITTDYADDESFRQKILINRVADPLSIYLDPDIETADGSDAKFAFVVSDMPKSEFKKQYPKAKNIDFAAKVALTSDQFTTDGDIGWCDEDHVRIVEYFTRYEQVVDKLHKLGDGSTIKQSDLDNQQALMQAMAELNGKKFNPQPPEIVQTRNITEWVVDYYKIAAGNQIIEQNTWPGSFIPLIRVVGEETVIQGEMDRRGHTRYLRGAQEIYNFYISAAVEQVAMQPKVPFIASKAALEGQEQDWAQIHLGRKPYYVYNHADDNNQKLDPPQRMEPPQISQAYMNLMQVALQDMMLTSGQYEANMGQKSNEVSGKAVDARQRQGDNATYHFIARLGDALRNSATQLLELIPKIYDEEQVVKILMPDMSSEQTVRIDPSMQQAHQQTHPDPTGEEYSPDQIAYALNPMLGKYAIVADVGPSYATKRQEEFAALSNILAQNQHAFPLLGDLWLKSADFPGADEGAQRLQRMLPPQAKSDQPDPAIQQLQMQLAQQHQVVQKQMADNMASKMDKDVDLRKLAIDEYKAETDRMSAVGKIDPHALIPIIREQVSQMLGMPANPVIAAHREENEGMAGSDTMMAQQAAQQSGGSDAD